MHKAYLHWCPGHVNIPGNEIVERLAKGGLDMEKDRLTPGYPTAYVPLLNHANSILWPFTSSKSRVILTILVLAVMRDAHRGTAGRE
jgi:hypothetical protein